MQKGTATPPSLRRLLQPCREADRDRYLVLREALLSIAGTREQVIRAGEVWLPSLWTRGAEILRARFAMAGRRGGGMALELNLAGRNRERLASAAELKPRTRALLGSGRGEWLRLQVRSDDDLAEGLALAMLLMSGDGP